VGLHHETTGERQCYVPEGLAVRDGLLVIEADRAEGGRLPYRSGMMVSARSFSRRYGYFELRARLPRARACGRPSGPCPSRPAVAPELDVMELFGSDPNTVLMGQHWRDAAGRERKRIRPWTGPDFTAGFHTFGLSWARRRSSGTSTGSSGSGRCATSPPRRGTCWSTWPVGGEAAGEPAATIRFPSRMEVDYVRVWEDWRRLRR
jgi:beta-glucanase (GH16 family)